MPDMISFAEKPYEEATAGPVPESKVYYPSFRVPVEAFGKTVPAVGSHAHFEIDVEIIEISKTERRRTEVRVEVKKGKSVSSKPTKKKSPLLS